MQTADYVVIAVIVGILVACFLFDQYVKKKWGGG
jgi:hypothetical protein